MGILIGQKPLKEALSSNNHFNMPNNILETIQAKAMRVLGLGTGLLYKQDDRDKFEDKFGIFGGSKPKYESLSHFRYQYEQRPNNTCTQCGVILALSEQMSVRWAIDPVTKLLVKQGLIRDNGFCAQHPPMGAVTYNPEKPDRLCGLIPNHLLPDGKNLPWSQLKQWTSQVQRAYEDIAPEYYMTGYKRLMSEQAVIEAMEAGFVPIIASKWHSEMNRPFGPNFFLQFRGYVVGGHQYRLTGYRKSGSDFENGQSFGENYGLKGRSYNETVFGSGYYEVWIMEHNGSPLIPMDKLLPLFLVQHEGLMVKAHDYHNDPTCYVIQGGVKRYVSGNDNMRTFQRLEQSVGLTRVNKTVLEAVPQGQDYPLT